MLISTRTANAAVLLLCLVLTPWLPQRIPAPQTAPYPTCATYGDSIAAGYHLLPGQQAFPAVLATLLRNANPGNCQTATVDATGGYTVEQELASLQARGAGPSDAALIDLELGTNNFNYAQYTPAQTTAAIEALLDYLTPLTRLKTLVCEDVWNVGSNTYGTVADYDAAIFAGCAARALHVYDVDVSPLFGVASYHGGICCGDTYHPNPDGIAAYAAAIYAPLAPPSGMQN